MKQKGPAFAVLGGHQAQDVPSIRPEEELHESTHVPVKGASSLGPRFVKRSRIECRGSNFGPNSGTNSVDFGAEGFGSTGAVSVLGAGCLPQLLIENHRKLGNIEQKNDEDCKYAQRGRRQAQRSRKTHTTKIQLQASNMAATPPKMMPTTMTMAADRNS